MRCKHNYVFTQGYFFCTKCGKRRHGKSYRRKKSRKIGGIIALIAILVVVGFLFSNNVLEINSEKLDQTIQNFPESIKETTETAKNIASDTTNKFQETVNDQIQTNQKTEDEISKTEKPKITLPEIELPKYEPPKEHTLEELKKIALDDINKYRKEKGLQTIVLGNAKSPQLYASELLIEGCIHHISDRGEGPMLRYKINNDKMYLLSENIGGGLGTSWETPEKSILESNYRMMYDDADSNWGHRQNILDPNHQSVSIGIAYDKSRLVMVQDFEQTLQPGWQYDPSSFQKEPVDQRFCW